MAVRGRNGHHVHAAFNERPDVIKDAFAIQFAEGIARGRDRRAAEEMGMGVARGLELRVAFLRDALHVAFGFALDYTSEVYEQNRSYQFGVGYLSNIAGSLYISTTRSHKSQLAKGYFVHFVPALDFHAKFTYRHF